MFHSIGAEGKSGLITVDRIKLGDIRALVEALRGRGDCGGTYGWEDSPGLEVLARLGGGGFSTGRV